MLTELLEVGTVQLDDFVVMPYASWSWSKLLPDATL